MPRSNWYVVYTRPRCELKVAQLLTRKHVINYCPLHVVERSVFESKKIIQQPVFCSFVFVNIEASEMDSILEVPGVGNFLYWLNKPAIISDVEIESLERVLKEYPTATAEKYVIRPGQASKEDQNECIVSESLSLRSQVKLVLPSLGYYIIAKSGKEMLAPQISS